MTNGTEKYIDSVKYLSGLYDYFNERLFENALSKLVITIQADEKNKAYGWLSLKKVWHEKPVSDKSQPVVGYCVGCPIEDTCTHEKCTMPRVEDEGANEINISAQYLNRPIDQIAATCIHEMCHYYALLNNIQDVSRGGTYHNKLFKKIGETHGLIIDYDKKIGWSVTTLTDESKQMVAQYVAEHPVSIIYRDPVFKGQKVKSSSTRKYECPNCGNSVRATKSVNLICADCDEIMKEVE